jgi:phosphatidylglycerophosphate synthase
MIAGMAAGTLFAATGHLAAHAAGSLGHLDWDRAFFLLAACCIQLRLLANMLDGMVALRIGTGSPLGELYNEVPDRVSDACILIGAGYAAGGVPELGYLAACVALFVAYVRAQGKAAGAPQEFCGPMAKQQRMAVLTLAALWVGLTPRAWRPQLAALPGWGVTAAAQSVIILGGAATAVRRLRRIALALRKARS